MSARDYVVIICAALITLIHFFDGFWFRLDGGIPPLVQLLESRDAKVQRAVAGTLRTLAFKNDENKNQVCVHLYIF